MPWSREECRNKLWNKVGWRKLLSNTHFQVVKFYSFLFQFLSKAAFPSKEDLPKTRGKEACWEEDSELKKEFGIIEDGESLFQ